MKKSLTLIGVASVVNKVASEAGELAQDVLKGVVKNTTVFVNGVSKNARRSLRIASKRSNKAISRKVKRFRKSAFYNSVASVPGNISAVGKLRFKKIRKTSVKKIGRAKKWVSRTYPKVQVWAGRTSNNFKIWMSVQYPKVREFVQDNYPRVQKFVMNELPVYRALMK